MSKCFLISVLLLILIAASSFGASPTVMNYQGRLTDNIGDPVADGNYTVTFTIYDAAVLGSSKWTETRLVTTSGGLFSLVLGSLSPIEDTVFNETDRYLGIQVDLDPELSPRTRFTTGAYSHRVNTIDGSTGGSVSGDVDVTSNSIGNAFSVSQTGLGRGGFFQVSNGGNTEAAVQGTHVGGGAGGSFFSDGGGPGISASATGGIAAQFTGAVNTFGDHVVFNGVDTAFHVNNSMRRISTFGSDGLEQVRIWGSSYGEIQLHDNTDNDVTVLLTATSNSGGIMQLMNEVGTMNIQFSGGSTGDVSAILPQSSISAFETSQEAGVANQVDNVSQFLTGGQDTILVRTIIAPASGFVLLLASCNTKFVHTSGVQSYVRVKAGLVGSTSMSQDVRVGTGSASANWEIPTTVQGIFSVTVGPNQFAVVLEEKSGTISVEDAQLTLVYFHTQYGTITSNTAANLDNGPITSAEELTLAETLNARRIDDELSALRKQMDELQAMLEAQEQ